MVISTWRVSFRRRLSGLAIAAAAEAAAIAVVVKGPRESPGFDLRLPLLVLAIGALAVAARQRRMIVVARDELAVRTLARTRRIAWCDVAGIRPRGARITVRRLNGRGCTLRTGADTFAVADAIEEALVRADLAVLADTDAMAGTAGTVRPWKGWRAPKPVRLGEPAPLATPWLTLNGTTGVAALAAKGYESHPALMAGLVGLTASLCLATLGGCLVQRLRSR